MHISGNGRTILVGEDEPEVRGYLEMALKCQGYSVELAEDGDEILECLHTSRSVISAVLLDLMMPNLDGMDTLREIRRVNHSLPIIIVSGAASTSNVVGAMKCGATDFLAKPVLHEDLQRAVFRAIDLKPAEYARPQRSSAPSSKAFLGSNAHMKEIQALIGQIGWSEAPVLIQGETGSGKEVIARELHAKSPRASKPFLKLNCAALPSELVESELFGHERGAFTGAFQRRAGMFEMADGGSILLDEIGDMDVRLQAKLLQVLQDHEFQRIGGRETIRVNVRVLAATHRDLLACIEENQFREDLYYRLNVINIQVPPLRDRWEDIVPLAEFLLKKHSDGAPAVPNIPAALKHLMTTYPWPGNVRELDNFVRRFIILRSPDALARELQDKTARRSLAPVAIDSHASGSIEAPRQTEVVSPILQQVTKAKEQAETEAILAVLHSTRWNRKQAAALLKIDYKALLYKMKKLGIDEKPVPGESHQAPFAAGQ